MRTPLDRCLPCLALLILLLSIGCADDASSGAMSCPSTFDGVIDVAMPSRNPDNGLGATIEDWNACAQFMACTALCNEVAPHSLKPFHVDTCELIAGAGTAGEMTLHLHVIASYDECASGT